MLRAAQGGLCRGYETLWAHARSDVNSAPRLKGHHVLCIAPRSPSRVSVSEATARPGYDCNPNPDFLLTRNASQLQTGWTVHHYLDSLAWEHCLEFPVYGAIMLSPVYHKCFFFLERKGRQGVRSCFRISVSTASICIREPGVRGENDYTRTLVRTPDHCGIRRFTVRVERYSGLKVRRVVTVRPAL